MRRDARPGKAPRGRVGPGLVTLILVCVAGLIVGLGVTPFHYLEAITIVAAAIVPPVLVAAGLAMRNATLERWLTSAGRLSRPIVLCGLAVVLVLAPGNCILALNELLDHSPAVAVTLPVRAAWIRTGRHKEFIATVEPNVASPLGGLSFFRRQAVRLLQTEWERIVPGRSALVLREHLGRFGFAWYEPLPTVTP